MLKLWGGLTVFLRTPEVPLDNNHVERQRRDMVVGRNNPYGSKSQRGTEVAALLPDGWHTVTVTAVDMSGNVSEPAIRRLFV